MKKREIFIKLTLTSAEKELMQRAADQLGMPLAVFVRVAALEEAKKVLTKGLPG